MKKTLLILLIFYAQVIFSQKLRITEPNGGDVFYSNKDNVISWIGASERDTVSLDYSMDKGKNWINITNVATGLKYIWSKAPDTIKNQCIIRVKNNSASNMITYVGGHSGYTYDHKFSPDGTKFLTSRGYSDNDDKLAILWDSQNGTILNYFPYEKYGRILNTSWKVDGSKILILSSQRISIWDSQKFILIDSINTFYQDTSHIHFSDSLFYDASWSPDGKEIAIYCNKSLYIIEDGTKKLLFDFKLDSSIKYYPIIKWSSYSDKITLFNNQYFVIWDLNQNTKVNFNIKNNLYDFNSNMTKFVTYIYDSIPIVWDAVSGKKLIVFDNFKTKIDKIIFSGDGQFIATKEFKGDLEYNKFFDTSISIWDANSGKLLNVIKDTFKTQIDFCWDNQLSQIVSLSTNNLIWSDALNGQNKYIKKLDSNYLYNKFILQKSKVLLLSDYSHMLIFDKIQNTTINCGSKSNQINGSQSNLIYYNIWSPDGNKVATNGLIDDKLVIWDVNTGLKIKEFENLQIGLNFSWNLDGTKLAFIKSNCELVIWDLIEDKTIIKYKFTAKDSYSSYVSWIYDNSLIVTINEDNGSYGLMSIYFINILSNKEPQLLFRSNNINNRSQIFIKFSEDKSIFVFSSYDGDNSSAIFRESETGNIMYQIPYIPIFEIFGWSFNSTYFTSFDDNYKNININESKFGKVIFQIPNDFINNNFKVQKSWSPTNNKLAVLKNDSTFLIWDSSKFDVLDTISTQNNKINYWKWSPDGTKIALTTLDSSLMILDVIKKEMKFLSSSFDINIVGSNWNWNLDGSKIAATTLDNSLILIDVLKNEIKNKTTITQDTIYGISWSPDQNNVITSGFKFKTYLFDAINGNLINKFHERYKWFDSVFSWNSTGNKIISFDIINNRFSWQNTSTNNLLNCDYFNLNINTKFKILVGNPNLFPYDGGSILKIYDFNKLNFDNDESDNVFSIIKDPSSINEQVTTVTSPFSPNPVKDKLFIKTTEFDFDDKIQILDLKGRKIIETELKESIDVSSLSKGIYFFKIGNKEWKFVKE